MSSNTTVVWSVKSINNGRKDSTTLSPLSLCCRHCHCVAQTLNILMFCRGSTLRNHHNYLSICADKRSSSFTLRRNRGFHAGKVWKCNLGKKMNSSVLGSTTTCKVSLSISLSTTLSVRNQQLSGVPTYMCRCNLSFGVALSETQAVLGRVIPGGGCRCRGRKCGVVWCCPTTPHSIGNPPTAQHVCCCCQVNWWVVVRRVQMGVSILGAVHLHSMEGCWFYLYILRVSLLM